MTGHEKRCKHLTSEDREEIQTGLNVDMAVKPPPPTSLMWYPCQGQILDS